jgi:hypothetical protein
MHVLTLFGDPLPGQVPQEPPPPPPVMGPPPANPGEIKVGESSIALLSVCPGCDELLVWSYRLQWC